VALLGPNGAGKTTTLNMLSGLLTPTSGTIRFKGVPGGSDLRVHIGYLPQYASFYGWMSAKEFLIYVGRLSRMSKQESAARADELLRMVGLAEAGNRRISGYSGGMKQRLGLAQAMIHRPRLLMLDEPVSALDPIGRREVLELLHRLKQETTVLFSTHVLHDAEEVCDDVLIIRSGDIVIAGSLDEVRREHQQPVIELEWDQDEEWHHWIPLWESWGAEAQVEGKKVKLLMDSNDDLKRIRKLLLRQAADENLSLRRYAVAQTTLEDLFMKAVNS
jgi:ABC-2 type transport system ATP-binding protein